MLFRYICGGAVVDCNHIVTVAHCVKSLYPEEISVRKEFFHKNKNIFITV